MRADPPARAERQPAATLAQLPLGRPARVVAVHPPLDAPHWARMLEELGFCAGEPVTLMARAGLGGDPLVARIGVSTFALRVAEAACVEVRLEAA